jgi:hypothetical protein
MTIRLALSVIAAHLLVAPAHAADPASAYCMVEQLSADEREALRSALAEADQASIAESILGPKAVACIAQHGWNQRDTENAVRVTSFAMLRGLLAETARTLGVPLDIAQLYFDTNRRDLVAAADDAGSNEALARDGLVALGFPADNAAYLEVALAWVGARVMEDRMVQDFASGQLRN